MLTATIILSVILLIVIGGTIVREKEEKRKKKINSFSTQSQNYSTHDNDNKLNHPSSFETETILSKQAENHEYIMPDPKKTSQGEIDNGPSISDWLDKRIDEIQKEGSERIKSGQYNSLPIVPLRVFLGLLPGQGVDISTSYWFKTIEQASSAFQSVIDKIYETIQDGNIIGVELFEENDHGNIGYLVIFSKAGGPYYKQDFFDDYEHPDSVSENEIEPIRMRNKLISAWSSNKDMVRKNEVIIAEYNTNEKEAENSLLDLFCNESLYSLVESNEYKLYDYEAVNGPRAIDVSWWKDNRELFLKPSVSTYNMAVNILTEAYNNSAQRGFAMLHFGNQLLAKGDYENAVKAYLFGASKNKEHKIENLKHAATVCLFNLHDTLNAIKLLCYCLLAINKETKGFGFYCTNVSYDQEEAIQYYMQYLTISQDYEPDFQQMLGIRLSTQLDSLKLNEAAMIIANSIKNDSSLYWKIMEVIADYNQSVRNKILAL